MEPVAPYPWPSPKAHPIGQHGRLCAHADGRHDVNGFEWPLAICGLPAQHHSICTFSYCNCNVTDLQAQRKGISSSAIPSACLRCAYPQPACARQLGVTAGTHAVLCTANPLASCVTQLLLSRVAGITAIYQKRLKLSLATSYILRTDRFTAHILSFVKKLISGLYTNPCAPKTRCSFPTNSFANMQGQIPWANKG